MIKNTQDSGDISPIKVDDFKLRFTKLERDVDQRVVSSAAEILFYQKEGETEVTIASLHFEDAQLRQLCDTMAAAQAKIIGYL